ncbi:MAG: TauD/TfdA family dioxygenase [Actinomycetota bacterium]
MTQWRVERLAPTLGARITGLNLASPLSADEIETLRRLLDEHHVLALPGQALTPDRHVEIGTWFGAPYLHPYLTPSPDHPAILDVRKEAHETEVFGGEHWHADITFTDPPAAVSLLYAVDIPPSGGDTLFADQHLAFETLPTDLRELARSLDAVHTYPGMREDDASATHPVVRVHPRTNRPALYVNPAFVHRFDRQTEAESRRVLGLLFEHQVRPEFQLRLSWGAGQLTVWDNRSVLHYAMNDHHGFRRHLQRVTAIEVSTPPTEDACR